MVPAKMGAGWPRDAGGETGDRSFGESMERVAAGNLVPSLPPNDGSHPAWAGHSPLSSSSLKGNNSPASKRLCPGYVLLKIHC